MFDGISSTPILTLSEIVTEAIKLKEPNFFIEAVNHYQLAISRDPYMIEYLDKIGVLYFGVKVKKETGMKAMFNAMFN